MQPGQGGDRVEAKVAAIGPGIDLAVLTIDPAEAEFFAKRPPLPRAGGLPEVSARVVVKGFPVGGTSLSTTQGIVSRIDYAYYDTGSTGLRIQVDAAINPGNSGGPALVDGKMAGLVFGVGRGRERRLPHPQRGDRRLPRPTSPTAATTASRSSPSSCRRSRTRRCGPSSGWPRPSAGSWSASRGGATRPTRSRSSTW